MPLERESEDMQRLLRLSLSLQQQEQQQSEAGEVMQAERRQFLREALTNLNTDPIETMKAALNVLSVDPSSSTTAPSGSDPQQQQQVTDDDKYRALCVLRDLADNIDMANDLQKLGGLAVLQRCLDNFDADETEGDDSGARERVWETAAGVVADMVQNNPQCQRALMSRDHYELLPRLLQLVASESGGRARVTSLQAVSGAVRHCPEAQRRFCQLDGCGALIAAMRCADQPRLQAKAAFLLASVCSSAACDENVVRTCAVEAGLCQQLCCLLQEAHVAWHEHVLAALCALLDGDSDTATAAASECRRAEFQLNRQLQLRSKQLANREDSLETVQHCNDLVKLLSFDTDDEQER